MPTVVTHAHSEASPDAGNTFEHLTSLIERREYDVIAITDHDIIDPRTIELANRYAGHVIVGEEITTHYGGGTIEIIGLFLNEEIEKGTDTIDAMDAIHHQGGLVYLPHPMDISRKGAPRKHMDYFLSRGGVDIGEPFNSRSVHRFQEDAVAEWCMRYGVAMASGADAHGPRGFNGTCNDVEEFPTAANFVDLLKNGTRFNVPASPLSMAEAKYYTAKKLANTATEMTAELAQQALGAIAL